MKDLTPVKAMLVMLLGTIFGADVALESVRLATCAALTDTTPPPVCVNRSNTLGGMMNRLLDLLGAEPLPAQAPAPKPEPEPKPEPAPAEPSPLERLRQLPAL